MIYLVRHGQTNWNVLGKYQGKTDIDLNQTGVFQAEKMKIKLQAIPFDIIFSTPLKRGYEIAKIISLNQRSLWMNALWNVIIER